MGLLEQIAADVAEIKQRLANTPAATQQVAAQPPVDPDAAKRAALEAQLAALNGGAQTTLAPANTAPANVTSDQLMALITPHLDNPSIKDALGGAMRAAGINALPEAQPHQYGDLYTRFQAVIAQHSGGTPQ